MELFQMAYAMTSRQSARSVTRSIHCGIAALVVAVACTSLGFAQRSDRPEEFVDNPIVVAEDDVAVDHRVINAIFEDGFLANNVRWLRSRTADMSSVDRFDYFTRWVLPTPDRPLFRLSGEFTQTDPAPIGVRQTPPSHAEAPRDGGQLVSPVFELLDVATQLGQLEVLRDRVKRQPLSDDEYQQRSQAALLVLINLELGDREAAESALDNLLTLVLHSTSTTVHEMWPETLVVFRGVQRHPVSAKITEILAEMHSRTMRGTIPGNEVWHSHVAALTNQQRHLRFGGTPQSLKNPAKLKNWIPAFRSTAATRGRCFP
jgi:hypothetical protein